MAPLIPANATGPQVEIFRCTSQGCTRYMRVFHKDEEPINILKSIFRCPYWLCRPNLDDHQEYDDTRLGNERLGNDRSENIRFDSQFFQTTTIKPPRTNDHDAILQFVAFKILLPIVMVLIAICFVLGVILIVKSYMMAPLKQNLATAIRRRRRFGHAPDNNYIPPAEMRASHRLSSISDRKSLPPPEVLIAARARASQLLAANSSRHGSRHSRNVTSA